jgi:hypothetical protein
MLYVSMVFGRRDRDSESSSICEWTVGVLAVFAASRFFDTLEAVVKETQLILPTSGRFFPSAAITPPATFLTSIDTVILDLSNVVIADSRGDEPDANAITDGEIEKEPYSVIIVSLPQPLTDFPFDIRSGTGIEGKVIAHVKNGWFHPNRFVVQVGRAL